MYSQGRVMLLRKTGYKLVHERQYHIPLWDREGRLVWAKGGIRVCPKFQWPSETFGSPMLFELASGKIIECPEGFSAIEVSDSSVVSEETSLLVVRPDGFQEVQLVAIMEGLEALGTATIRTVWERLE